MPQPSVMSVVVLVGILFGLSYGQDGDDGLSIVSNCSTGSIKADVHFLVDGSGSVGYDNFRKQVQFIHNFANSFNISRNNVHLGVTTFSDVVHHEFWMNQHQTKQGLLAAIDNMHYPQGTTHTELGLEYMRQQAFTPAHGDRPGVANVLVVLTDGQSTDPASTKLEADDVHKLNLNVISVGIGSGVDPAELGIIATDAGNVITVSDFDALDNIRHQIVDTVCDESVNSKCNAPIDLAFLVDHSASIHNNSWGKEKQVIEDIIDKFHVSPDEVRVGMALFANNPRHKWCFENYTSKADVIDAVRNLSCPECLKGETVTGQALKWAREFMFTSNCGSRPFANKVVVVMTDGHSTEQKNGMGTIVQDQAKLLHDLGATVVSIGVGRLGGHGHHHSNQQGQTELRDIASSSDLVFLASDYDKLYPMMDNIALGACAAVDYTPLCDKPIDLTFILDQSNGYSHDNFNVEEEFMEQIIGTLDISPQTTQVSLVTYGYDVTRHFCFNDHVSQNELIKTVQNLTIPTRSAAGHNLGHALNEVQVNVLTQACGMRPAAKQIVVLISAGNSTEPDQYLDQHTKALQATGATILAVGVGDNVDGHELADIATGKHHGRGNVFKTDNFQHLLPLMDKVSDKICSSAPTPPKAACSTSQQTKACTILQSQPNAQLSFSHQQGHLDHATAFNNIQDMCDGKQASRSNFTCPECPSGAPGGTVCLTNWVLDYLIRLVQSGPVSINLLTGGCEDCNSPHYTGHAADVSNPARHAEFVTTCTDMGGFPTDKTTHVMCAFN